MSTDAKPAFLLPAGEDELWHQVVVRLLEQRNILEEDAVDHLRLLEELAFHQYFCGRRPLTHAFTLATATWVVTQQSLGNPGEKARKCLCDLTNWELLVCKSTSGDATYEFPFDGLDMYFAARHVASQGKERRSPYQTWLGKGWTASARKCQCPNPHCAKNMAPFREQIRGQQHEELVLLLAGLVGDRVREEAFLKCFPCHLRLADVGYTGFILMFVLALVSCIGSVPIGCIALLSNDKGLAWTLLLPVILIPVMLLINIYSHPVYTLLDPLHDLSVRLRIISRLCHCHVRSVRSLVYAMLQSEYMNIDASAPGRSLLNARVYDGLRDMRSARVQANYEEIVAVCLKKLSGGGVVFRWRAFQNVVIILGILGDVRAVQPLLNYLSTGRDEDHWTVAEALGLIGDPRSTEPLIHLLRSRTSYVRGAAATALGNIGSDRAVEPLIAVATTDVIGVRQAARAALRKLRSKVPAAQQAAVEQLLSVNPDAELSAELQKLEKDLQL